MEADALRQAWVRWHRAKDAAADLANARNGDDAEDAWDAFLTACAGVYLKLHSGSRENRSKGWSDSREGERRNDPLLSYLLHARNAETHGARPTLLRSGGGTTFSLRDGDVLTVHCVYDGRRWNCTHAVAPADSARPSEPPTFKPERYELPPVVDRGKEYPAPRAHLGLQLPDTSPTGVAGVALSYLRAMLSEAERLPKP